MKSIPPFTLCPDAQMLYFCFSITEFFLWYSDICCSCTPAFPFSVTAPTLITIVIINAANPEVWGTSPLLFFSSFFNLFCILLITHVIKTKNIKPFSKGQLPSGPWTWRIKWEMTSSVVLLLCVSAVHGLTATSFQFRGCDVLVLFQSHFGNLRMLNYWILISQYLFSHSKPVLGDCLVSILPCYISEYFGTNEIYVLFMKINRLEGIK